MLATLMLVLQAVAAGSILYALLVTLVPFASGFIASEIAKAWAWVQALGGVLGAVVGAAISAAVALGFAWLMAHIPGLPPLPGDLGGLSPELVVAILTGVLNSIFNVPPAMKASRLKKGAKF